MNHWFDWLDAPEWAAGHLSFAGSQIGICVAVGVLCFAFPRLRDRSALLVLSGAAAVITYRLQYFGALFVLAAVYLIAMAMTGRFNRGATDSALRWRVATVALVAFCLIFLCFRTDSPTALIGSRYDTSDPTLAVLDMLMFIRLVTFLWEIGSGRFALPGLREYALWGFLPFTVWGPILRYSEFQAQLPRLVGVAVRPAIPAGWSRALVLALLQLVVGVALALAIPFADADGVRGRLAITLLLGPWGWYLQLAGYTNSMRALGVLWGLEIPTNFDRPFGRRNIADFWSNWNITATSVFRDYLFYNRWGRRRVNIYANSVLLFFMVGVWHAANPYWMIFGLYHGIGFAFYLWHKKQPRSLFDLLPAHARGPAAVTVTYLFVVGAWAIPPQVMKLFA